MKNVNKVIAIISRIRNNANKLIIEHLDAKVVKGLAPSHGDVLQVLLHSSGGVTMNTLASKIGRDKSTLTALVNKLEKHGFVEKLKSLEDSRSTLVQLTSKGKELKPIFDEVSQKLLDTTYSGFTQKEKEVLVDLLIRVNNNY